jgi:hypothetical protein
MRQLTLRSGLIAVALLLSLAGAAGAKEGGQARLDAPIPPDAEPGSTIEIGWRVWVVEEGTEQPVIGSPLFVRLTSRDGSETVEASGHESPSGSGHYVASVTVPQGGVSVVMIGMRGTSCVDGQCARSDMEFALDDADRLPMLGPISEGSTSGGPARDEEGTFPVVPLAVLLAATAGLATIAAASRLRRARLTAPTAGS